MNIVIGLYKLVIICEVLQDIYQMSAYQNNPTGKQTRYNIYLNDNETRNIKENNVTEADKGNAYMFLIHDKLRKDHDELRYELIKMQEQYTEIENDNGRMEKTIINLKGYIRNINTLNNLNKLMVKKYIQYQKDTAETTKVGYSDVRYFINNGINMILTIILLQVLLCVTGLILFNTMVFNLINLTPVFAYYIYKIRVNYWDLLTSHSRLNIKLTQLHGITQHYNHEITKIKEDIKEVSRGIDFLSEVLDTM